MSFASLRGGRVVAVVALATVVLSLLAFMEPASSGAPDRPPTGGVSVEAVPSPPDRGRPAWLRDGSTVRIDTGAVRRALSADDTGSGGAIALPLPGGAPARLRLTGPPVERGGLLFRSVEDGPNVGAIGVYRGDDGADRMLGRVWNLDTAESWAVEPVPGSTLHVAGAAVPTGDTSAAHQVQHPELGGGAVAGATGGRSLADLIGLGSTTGPAANHSTTNDIDLVVGYTADARAELGTTTDIEARIQWEVNLTNLALDNSNIGHLEIDVVAKRLVTFNENDACPAEYVGILADKDAILNGNKGSELRLLRSEYDADLVQLWGSYPLHTFSCGVGGAGALPSSLTPDPGQYFSSVINVDHSAALGALTVAHELGHNLSLNHDRSSPTMPNPATPYGYGYVSAAGQFGTVMAYTPPGYTRIPYFSNPSVSYNGQLTGVAGSEDSARAISQIFPAVSAYADPSVVFYDVADSHPFATEVRWLGSSGVQVETPQVCDAQQPRLMHPCFRSGDGLTFGELLRWTHELAGSPTTAAPDPGMVDVPVSDPLNPALRWAFDKEVAAVSWVQSGNSYFWPWAPVTRAYLARWLWRLAGQPAGPFAAPGYSDVAPSNPDYTAISWAKARGVLAGYTDAATCSPNPAPCFNPGATVSHQVGAVGLYRLNGQRTFTDLGLASPFFTEIEWSAARGYLTGYTTGCTTGSPCFKPTTAISRQGAAVTYYRTATPTFTAPSTASFTDVSTAHPFFRDIEWFVDRGITTGYTTGCTTGSPCYKPTVAVSRQAAARFLRKLACSPAYTPPSSPTFTDVPASSPFYVDIEWANANGLLRGTGTTFSPGDPLSRQAQSAILWRMDRAGLMGDIEGCPGQWP